MFEKNELIQLKDVHSHWLFARFIANNQAKDVLSLNNSSDNSSFDNSSFDNSSSDNSSSDNSSSDNLSVDDSFSSDDILLAMRESFEFERVKEIF